MSNEPPCISQQQVQQALRALWSPSNAHPPNALLHLTLVDEALGDPDLPCSPHDREYVFNERLTHLVARSYTAWRAALALPEPLDLPARLRQEARAASPDLLAWSWLYHHFVRVDLSLTADAFCAATSLDARTLRRYQLRALAQLTATLMAEERQARQRFRQQRLYAALPMAAPVRIYGREPLLASLRQWWTQDASRLVLVTGGPGNGKTTLAQAAVRERIQREAVDYLVWVERPATVTAVHEQLAGTLRMAHSPLSLRDYAARYELLLVIDGLADLAGEWARLERLLADLSTEAVLLVDRHYHPLRPLARHLVVDALDETATLQLLRDVLAGEMQAGRLTEADLETVWRSTRGHPQAVCEAVDRLRGLE